MKQGDIKDTDTLITYLNTYNKRFSAAYHYTTLGTLAKIFENRSFRLSCMDKMNDKFEKDLFRTCTDFFMCFSRGTEDEMENFGMWSMYGNLGTKVGQPSARDADKIGVKIYFPKDALQHICAENKAHGIELRLHSVAYAKIIEHYAHLTGLKAYVGSSSGIPITDFDKEKLSGYLKDTAWKYENEIRLRCPRTTERVTDETKDIPVSDAVLSQLKIYPSPLYDRSVCEGIFDELCKGKTAVRANFCENIYRGTLNRNR